MNVPEILLVEDNASTVELMRYALKKNNIANPLHVARDGAQALDFLFGTGAYAARDITMQPAVVLLDLKLPKISGLEVLRRLRADERTRLTPVVVVSASREEQDIAKSYELGVNGYVVKPIDFERFTQMVGNLGLYWLLLNEPPKH
ncbi:MAG: two-component system response regulator [Chloroflexi bacterium RBG_16_56_8]|nr:MAG: two-component system response regulator [Chloroflexi bacterium RBG_16_56_8]